jgi:hypothetical protein
MLGFDLVFAMPLDPRTVNTSEAIQEKKAK